VELYTSQYISKAKDVLHSSFDGVVHPSLIYLAAAFTAQTITLGVYYPFDLIKIRLQTSNKRYKYRSIPEAFRREVRQNGIGSLYRGAVPYIMTSIVSTCIWFTIYESVIKNFKENDSQLYQQKEPMYVIIASVLSGSVASFLCNGPEALVALKQAHPEQTMMQLMKQEKFRLLRKGLGINMYYHSIHSAMFFLTVTYVGKIFNVEVEG